MRDMQELKGFIELEIKSQKEWVDSSPEHSLTWVGVRAVLKELEYILDNFLT